MKTKDNNKVKSGIMLTAVVVIITMFMGCSKSSNSYGSNNNNPPPTQGSNEVWIQSLAFSPSTITVSVNTTVKWTNKAGVAHTVTSDDGLFVSSGTINPNGTFSSQFTTAGTFNYHCSIHPSMVAKVIVQ